MLKDYRKQIDTIDEKILQLLEERLSLVEAIYRIKQKQKLPITDTQREKQMLKKYPKSYQKALLQCLMDLSKQYQHQLSKANKDQPLD